MAGIKGLVRDTVLDCNRMEVSVMEICKDKKVVCLYFSCGLCPRCRGFTHTLVDFYKANKEDCVIIFVSSDKDQDSFDAYFKDMPWYALPYSERKQMAILNKKYAVCDLPTLVVLKPDGSTIETDGRFTVQSAKGKFPKTWK